MAACTKCLRDDPECGFLIRKDRGKPYRQCRDCMNARKWHKSNPEKHRDAGRRWVASNRDRAREIWREMRSRRMSRPEVRVHARVSNQIYCSLSMKKSGKKTFDMLGYTATDLKSHLEAQFTAGMSWDNHGDWHIDHIVPLAEFSFDGDIETAVKRAWALSNLRPIWAKDNLSKGRRREFLV